MTPDDGDQASASGAPDLLALVAPSFETEALTTQGRIVRIRAVTAGHGAALRALNGRISVGSLYLRFFACNRRVADDFVAKLVRPQPPTIPRSPR